MTKRNRDSVMKDKERVEGVITDSKAHRSIEIIAAKEMAKQRNHKIKPLSSHAFFLSS